VPRAAQAPDEYAAGRKLALLERANMDYLAPISWPIAYGVLRLPSWLPYPGRSGMRRAEKRMRDAVALDGIDECLSDRFLADEIAELLRLPVNTVRSRLFRSRMALKDHLQPKRRPHRENITAKPTQDQA